MYFKKITNVVFYNMRISKYKYVFLNIKNSFELLPIAKKVKQIFT